MPRVGAVPRGADPVWCHPPELRPQTLAGGGEDLHVTAPARSPGDVLRDQAFCASPHQPLAGELRRPGLPSSRAGHGVAIPGDLQNLLDDPSTSLKRRAARDAVAMVAPARGTAAAGGIADVPEGQAV